MLNWLSMMGRLLRLLVGFLLGIVLFASFLQLLFRNLGIPLSWTEAVARLAFIWATFLIMPVITLNMKHITITFFRTLAPRPVQIGVQLAGGILVVIVFCWATIEGVGILRVSWGMIEPALHIPSAVFYLPVWIGLVGAVLGESVNVVRLIIDVKCGRAMTEPSIREGGNR